VRYPIVELGTGLFFAAVTLWALVGRGVPAQPPAATVAAILVVVAFLYLAAVTVALAMIDIDTHTLPNRIVLPSYAVGAVLLGTAAALIGDGGTLLRAGIGMAALGLLYLGAALAYPGGMGFGDVKLAGVLGLFLGFLGWNELIVGAFAAFILGGVFGLVLIAARKAGRTSGIPFGPWMLAGAWVGVFFGGPIATGYLSLVGLA
jgi:leader peptidase (prepilin peptidase)/N-methyltransferase